MTGKGLVLQQSGFDQVKQINGETALLVRIAQRPNGRLRENLLVGQLRHHPTPTQTSVSQPRERSRSVMRQSSFRTSPSCDVDGKKMIASDTSEGRSWMSPATSRQGCVEWTGISVYSVWRQERNVAMMSSTLGWRSMMKLQCRGVCAIEQCVALVTQELVAVD